MVTTTCTPGLPSVVSGLDNSKALAGVAARQQLDRAHRLSPPRRHGRVPPEPLRVPPEPLRCTRPLRVPPEPLRVPPEPCAELRVRQPGPPQEPEPPPHSAMHGAGVRRANRLKARPARTVRSLSGRCPWPGLLGRGLHRRAARIVFEVGGRSRAGFLDEFQLVLAN